MTTTHIQIHDVNPRISYVGDGAQVDFTYPFALFHAQDLTVYLDDTLQVSGYTVSGVGVSAGGLVTFSVPPAWDQRVTLIRDLPIERITDFQVAGAFRAQVVNDELDYLTACLQQVHSDVSRSLRLSPSSADVDLVLPSPRAGYGLVWNATEDGLENSSLDVTAGVQAAAQAQAIYTQLLSFLGVSSAAGLIGLVNNLLGIVQSTHPEHFDLWGDLASTTGTSDYGLVSVPSVSAPDYGALYL